MSDIANAMGGREFRPDEHEPLNDFEAIPAGDYLAEIDEAEVKETKDGTGAYLKVRVTLLGGDYDNRKLFANINLENKNPKAKEIGHRELASLGVACGLSAIQSSDQLLKCQVVIKVKVKDDPQYGPQNEIKGWKSPDGSTPAPARNAAPAASQAEAARTEAARNGMAKVREAGSAAPPLPPWKRK